MRGENNLDEVLGVSYSADTGTGAKNYMEDRIHPGPVPRLTPTVRQVGGDACALMVLRGGETYTRLSFRK